MDSVTTRISKDLLELWFKENPEYRKFIAILPEEGTPQMKEHAAIKILLDCQANIHAKLQVLDNRHAIASKEIKEVESEREQYNANLEEILAGIVTLQNNLSRR